MLSDLFQITLDLSIFLLKFQELFRVLDSFSNIISSLLLLFQCFSHNHKNTFQPQNINLHMLVFIHQLTLLHFLFSNKRVSGI